MVSLHISCLVLPLCNSSNLTVCGICLFPCTGAAYDYTQKFDIAFYVGGGMFFVSAILTIIIPILQKAKGWIPQVITKNDSSSSMETASTETVEAGEEIVEEYVWVV